jgi:hypothetical protein
MTLTKAQVTTKDGKVNSDKYVAGLLNRIEMLKASRDEWRLDAQTARSERDALKLALDGSLQLCRDYEAQIISLGAAPHGVAR